MSMAEGTLVRSSNQDRFAVNDSCYGPDVTSGAVLSIWLDGRWVQGCVEYARVSGYYFVARQGGVCPLAEGMRVRLS